jgi:hypothetical protein
MSETTKTIKKYLGYTVEPLKEAGRLSLGVIVGASTYYFIETILVLELVYAYTFALLGIITGYKIADPLASGIKSVGMGAYNAMINAKNWLTKTKPKVIVKSKVDKVVDEVVDEVVDKKAKVEDKVVAKVDEKEVLENLDRTRTELPASLLADIRRGGREEGSKSLGQADSLLPVSPYGLFSSPAKVSGLKGTIEHLHTQLIENFEGIGRLEPVETDQYERILGLLRPDFAGNLPEGPQLKALRETKGEEYAEAFIKTALLFQENYIDFLGKVKHSLEVNTPDAYKPTESDDSPAYKKTFMDGSYQQYLAHFLELDPTEASDYESMIECALLPIGDILNMTSELHSYYLKTIGEILKKSNKLQDGSAIRELFRESDSEEDSSFEGYSFQ